MNPRIFVVTWPDGKTATVTIEPVSGRHRAKAKVEGCRDRLATLFRYTLAEAMVAEIRVTAIRDNALVKER